MRSLLELYEKSSAAFSTADRLYSEVQRRHLPFSRQDVEIFLKQMKVHSDNQRRYHKPHRTPSIISYGMFDLHAADLMFLKKIHFKIGVLIV